MVLKPEGGNRPALSITIPLYNEQESVRPLYDKIRDACKSTGTAFEMIFVDDGSSDGTFAFLEQLHRDDPAVRVIRFRKNYGQTAAMAAGFAHARGEVIVSMDGDLQNDPADIPRLLAKLSEGYDVVCGWRKDRKDKFISRRIPSMAANWIIGKITGVPIHDNGCSLKAYRASVIKRVALYGEMHRFIPALSTLTGATVAEIIVNHHPRRFGKSKYGIGRVWRVAMDILTVKMLTGFASRPALWFATLSAPFFLLGSLALIGSLISYLDPASERSIVYPTVCLLFYFLAGYLISLGIMSELILKTGDDHLGRDVVPAIGEAEGG